VNVENKYKMYAPQTSQYLWSIVKTNVNRNPAIAYQEVFNKYMENAKVKGSFTHINKLYFSGAHPELFILRGVDPRATYNLSLILAFMLYKRSR